MAYTEQNFHDLLALARVLRRFAQDNGYDGRQRLLLDAAAALEERAFSLSNDGTNSHPIPSGGVAPPHVNLMI